MAGESPWGGIKHKKGRGEKERAKRRRTVRKRKDHVAKHKKDPRVGTGKKPKGSGRRLYTDENPKDTIRIKFATAKDAQASVRKIRASGRTHAHKTQAAIAMEQRARAADKKAAAAVYRKFIESQKRKTRASSRA